MDLKRILDNYKFHVPWHTQFDYSKFMIFLKYIMQVAPGYLRELIPAHAPEKAEPWTDVMKDIDRVIMPGVTHWHHPQVDK